MSVLSHPEKFEITLLSVEEALKVSPENQSTEDKKKA